MWCSRRRHPGGLRSGLDHRTGACRCSADPTPACRTTVGSTAGRAAASRYRRSRRIPAHDGPAGSTRQRRLVAGEHEPRRGHAYRCGFHLAGCFGFHLAAGCRDSRHGAYAAMFRPHWPSSVTSVAPRQFRPHWRRRGNLANARSPHAVQLVAACRPLHGGTAARAAGFSGPTAGFAGCWVPAVALELSARLRSKGFARRAGIRAASKGESSDAIRYRD
jgi:hypothetical protein